jgi:hypothetical protein
LIIVGTKRWADERCSTVSEKSCALNRGSHLTGAERRRREHHREVSDMKKRPRVEMHGAVVVRHPVIEVLNIRQRGG